MLPTQLLPLLHKPRRLCVRGTRPSPTTRRTGHPAVLMTPARSKAWATRRIRLSRTDYYQSSYVVPNKVSDCVVGFHEPLVVSSSLRVPIRAENRIA